MAQKYSAMLPIRFMQKNVPTPDAMDSLRLDKEQVAMPDLSQLIYSFVP